MMSGSFAQLGRVDTGEGESVSVDLQIDSKEGDRVLLSALPGQVALTVAEAGKLSCLLRDAARHVVGIQRNRASAECEIDKESGLLIRGRSR